MQHKKDIVWFVTGTSWGVLGFTRGLNSYDYNYTKFKSIHKEPYLYSSKGYQGLMGIGLYMNPFLLPFNLYKEIYRLEVNLRSLEEERKTDYYNNLFG
jgi:hypothetical protein